LINCNVYVYLYIYSKNILVFVIIKVPFTYIKIIDFYVDLHYSYELLCLDNFLYGNGVVLCLVTFIVKEISLINVHFYVNLCYIYVGVSKYIFLFWLNQEIVKITKEMIN